MQAILTSCTKSVLPLNCFESNFVLAFCVISASAQLDSSLTQRKAQARVHAKGRVAQLLLSQLLSLQSPAHTLRKSSSQKTLHLPHFHIVAHTCKNNGGWHLFSPISMDLNGSTLAESFRLCHIPRTCCTLCATLMPPHPHILVVD